MKKLFDIAVPAWWLTGAGGCLSLVVTPLLWLFVARDTIWPRGKFDAGGLLAALHYLVPLAWITILCFASAVQAMVVSRAARRYGLIAPQTPRPALRWLPLVAGALSFLSVGAVFILFARQLCASRLPWQSQRQVGAILVQALVTAACGQALVVVLCVHWRSLIQWPSRRASITHSGERHWQAFADRGPR